MQNCSNISQCIYYLQEALTHFGLGVLANFGSKNQTRKIDKIHKNFELYQVFMYNSVPNGSNISQSLYYSQKDSAYFSLEVSTHFGLGVLANFGLKHYTQKIDKIHNDFWTISTLHVPKCLDTPILYPTDTH